MYYPEEIVEQVVASNDIVDVIGQYVHLKKSGSSYSGLCPFHNEKTPSFSVSPAKQIFHCFGCGASGNSLTFLMKYENYSFQEALKVLADRSGIKLPEVNYSQASREKAQQKERLLAINKEAATYYYKLLRSPKGKKGMDYLTERGLTPEIMNRFGLGYADGASSDLTAHLKDLGFTDKEILDAGVAAFDEKRGLHDKFWNRVMYPIMDTTNKVIGFGGRVMGDAKPKYLNSPETVIFDKSRNLYGLNIAKRTKARYFVLCEGYMDVIAMHQAGFDMAVASLGTSFTDGQAQMLKRYTSQVLLDYDSDGAGVKAAMRNMGILKQHGLPCKVVDMRPAKDADEFMKTLGRDEFQKRLDNAENSFFYEIRQLEAQCDMSDPDSKTRFYHQIAKKLCDFDDDIERDNYISAMANKYMINAAVLRKEVAGYNLAGGNQPMIPRPVPKPKSGTENKKLDALTKAHQKNERLLLTWISDSPKIYDQVRQFISPEDFEEGVYRRAAKKYFDLQEQTGIDELSVAAGASSMHISPSRVIAVFEDEEEQRIAASLFEERIPGLEKAAEKEKALKDVLTSIKRQSLQNSTNSGDLSGIIRGKQTIAQIQKTHFDFTE